MSAALPTEDDVRRVVVEVVGDQLAHLERRLLAALGRRPADEPDHMLTPRELAARLGVTRREIPRMEVEGRIPPAVRIGSRSPRWSSRTLEDWERRGCPRGEPPVERRLMTA